MLAQAHMKLMPIKGLVEVAELLAHWVLFIFIVAIDRLHDI